MNNKSKGYLTPKETAAFLKVSTETVRQWAKTGQLRAETTLGGHRRFNIDDVNKLAESIQNKTNKKGQLRILIVDDNEQHVRFVEELLKTFSDDIDVDKAYDGFEAGHKVDVFKPSIVLLDLIMPNINGIEVCRYLKQNKSTKDIRIIATTGFTSDINVANFMNAGAEVVLSKPLDHDELRDLVLRTSYKSAEA